MFFFLTNETLVINIYEGMVVENLPQTQKALNIHKRTFESVAFVCILNYEPPLEHFIFSLNWNIEKVKI